MRIALVQQRASSDTAANRAQGMEAVEEAARLGARLICFAEPAFEPFHPQEPAAGGVLDLAERIPGPTTEAFASLAERLGVAICYDRHYPEYMRALALGGAGVVVVPQAGAVDEWPEGLFEAEMRVAAFQNGYFTALCNRVGKERKLEFSGESFVCDPDGVVIARAGRGTEEILLCDLDLGSVEHSHERRYFFQARRPELYRAWLK